MKLFDRTLTGLEQALDVRLTRQNVLAGDVANVDTPGFRPRDLDFARAMQAAAQNEAGAPLNLSGEISENAAQGLTAPAGLDGNAVDLDRTMVALAENALQYGAVARTALEEARHASLRRL